MKYFKNLLQKKKKPEQFWISIPKYVASHEDYDTFIVKTMDFIKTNVNINSKFNNYV